MTIPRRLAVLGAALSLAVVGVIGFAAAASAAQPGGAVRELVEGATIQVTPDVIDAGGTTTVSGTGCLGRREIQQAVHIFITDDSENVVATGRAEPDSDGEWTTDIKVDTPGTFSVLASCDDYVGESPDDYPAQTLTVNEVKTTTTSQSPTDTSAPCAPTLTLVDYPGTVAQGGTLGIKITCYQPGESVQVVLHSDPILLTTLIVDSSGNAGGTVTIPLEAPIGGHTITVVGQLSGISLEASIEVVAAAEATATVPLTQTSSSTAQAVVETSTIGLASTGVNAAALTIWGVVLLMAGGIAVTLSRRRDGKHVGD